MPEQLGHNTEEESYLDLPENGETASKFHFQELTEIEPAAVSLVRQLKEKIDHEEYDTLISDDVGGRIPTLLFRKIIKELRPDQALETFFIASGKSYLPKPMDDVNYGVMLEHLRRTTRHTKKALIITQYIHSGDTVLSLSNALRDSGITDFDIAAVDALPGVYSRASSSKTLGGETIYIGSDDWHQLHEKHEELGGVRKSKTQYMPFPSRMADVISQEGRELSQEEWADVFGIKPGDSIQVINEKANDVDKNSEYERRKQAPLTPEEVKEIQHNINSARADVAMLANRVIEQVWGKI